MPVCRSQLLAQLSLDQLTFILYNGPTPPAHRVLFCCRLCLRLHAILHLILLATPSGQRTWIQPTDCLSLNSSCHYSYFPHWIWSRIDQTNPFLGWTSWPPVMQARTEYATVNFNGCNSLFKTMPKCWAYLIWQLTDHTWQALSLWSSLTIPRHHFGFDGTIPITNTRSYD